MKQGRVLMVGGSGFVGSAVVRQLAAAGMSVTVATRRRERARQLLVFPTVDVVEADVHDPAALERLMHGCSAVISLVGILQGGYGRPYGAGFSRAHVELPAKLGAAVARAGVPRVVHVSALKAASDAPSGYLRSKAAGEAALIAAAPEAAVTCFRPSVVFGADDAFLNLFARLQRIFPVLPLACADAQFQPVWVEDVAATIVTSLDRSESFGQTYDLCGPRIWTLRELVRLAGATSGHPRPVLGLPDGLGWLQAWAMECVPGAPMSRDNVLSMQLPNTCAAGCGLPFGRVAMPLESVVGSYLGDGGLRAHYATYRERARR